MATRPELHIAVAKQKSKASEYNDNFDMMMDYIDAVALEDKTYVDSFMPSVTGQSGKFLTNDGTDTSWVDIFAANNTFTGNNTFSGNITISGGTFNFPKCTTKPTTTSTASSTLPAVVVENYLNGASWYRVYSDGWCEQGGIITSVGSSQVVTLLKEYKDTNYYAEIHAGTSKNDSGGSGYSTVICGASPYTYGQKVGSFRASTVSDSNYRFAWRACGYIN